MVGVDFVMAANIQGPYTKEQSDKIKNLNLQELVVPESTRDEIDKIIKSIERE